MCLPPPVEEVGVSNPEALLPDLNGYVGARLAELDTIPRKRAELLGSLARFVADGVAAEKAVRLVFICTHNSRRSHMAQLWADVASHFFGVPDVQTYSGGSESTSFNSRVVAALNRAGFLIEPFSDGANPTYEVSHRQEMEPTQAFSKVYSDPPNPIDGFAAVMTCADADARCPVVDGADQRFSLPYDDPGDHDGTSGEAAAYDECCRQIAREMLYVFSQTAAD